MRHSIRKKKRGFNWEDLYDIPLAIMTVSSQGVTSFFFPMQLREFRETGRAEQACKADA
jgi:hypothetical protein